MQLILKLLLIVEFFGGTFCQKPNIVFILTDDQDSVLDSLSAMPKLQSLVGDKGITFVNSFVASPLCCPSRSSIFTGQYVHNHRTINNTAEGGCGSINWQNGAELNSFPLLLNNNGYTTFLAGKYLNTYGQDDLGGISRIPPGWSSWIGLKGNSVYYNYSLSVNGIPVIYGDEPIEDYLTNVIKKEAINFIQSYSEESPFFMMLSTPASHFPFTSEPQYEKSLNSSTVPRYPNFNIVNVNKNWFLQFGEQPLRPALINDLEEDYRNRLRTLLSVDDMIESVIQSLESKGLLENTYIFFSSDNGFHIGQYSLPMDKKQPYESDIRVPLIVRGPGILEGIQTEVVTTNIDLAPTFLSLAGISIPQNMDGISLTDVLLNRTLSLDITERSMLIEHSGQGIDGLHPGCEYLGTGLQQCFPFIDCKCTDSRNNTYNCVRLLGNENNELYCSWTDYEFEEYYNITSDPYQIENHAYQFSLTSRYDYLKSILEHLVSCSGANCSSIAISL